MRINSDPLVDACISLCPLPENICNFQIPFIAQNGGTSCCFFDTEEGIKTILQHFLDEKRKKAAFIGEFLTTSKADIFKKYCDGLIFTSDFRFEEAGKQAANHFIENGLPDSVICAYDEIAFGFIDTLNSNGIRIPSEVTVVGINNIKSSGYFFVGISTLGFNYQSVFRIMIQDIISDVYKHNIKSRSYHIGHYFAIRNS